MRPKLVEDGRSLVGLDIAADRILGVNVCSPVPGGLGNCEHFGEVDFCRAVLDAVEAKVVKAYGRGFSNAHLGTCDQPPRAALLPLDRQAPAGAWHGSGDAVGGVHRGAAPRASKCRDDREGATVQPVAPDGGGTSELTEDEADVRRIALAWVDALARQDVDRLMGLSSPDVQLFHLEPPLRLEGLAAYRRLWRACEPDRGDALRSTCRDMSVSAGRDVGFANFLMAVRIPEVSGEEGRDAWVRGTLCFERQADGRWQVVHEHRSAPINFRTGRASFDVLPLAGVDRPASPR